MADKRKLKKGKKGADEFGTPTKEETAVARFLRFNCEVKETLIMDNRSYYFVGSKAIDTLIASKWSGAADSKRKPNSKDAPLFSTRDQCASYLTRLIQKGMFYHAKKLVPRSAKQKMLDEIKASSKKSGTGGETADSAKEGGTPRRRKKDKGEGDEPEEDEDDAKKEKKKKKEKKIKLVMHEDQVFVDGADVFVWHYEFTSMWTWVIGGAIVFGSIGMCMFPLWPSELRVGIYYVSMTALGCLGSLLGVAALRTVLFGIIWACTMGRHHLWLLPNLTEDVGFFESFKPRYTYKYYPPGSAEKKKKKKDKESDEDEGSNDSAEQRKEAVLDEENVEGSGSEEVQQEDSQLDEEEQELSDNSDYEVVQRHSTEE